MNGKFANLVNHSLIKIQGDDSKKFLQGQLSCDMEDVSLSQCRLAVHCNPKGRVISSYRVWLFKDSYYLSVPSGTLETSMAALKKYAIFSKVEISQELDLNQGVIVCPEENPSLLSAPSTVDQVEIKDDSLISRIPGKNICYQVIGPICDILADKFQQVSLKEIELESIQAGIATITEKTQEKFTPHALSLQNVNAISFTKGCYTGQEIVARMQYLGKLKEQLYLFQCQTETTPEVGQELVSTEDKTVGTIINICQSSEHIYQGLAVMKIAAAENEILLGTEKIKILSLPF